MTRNSQHATKERIQYADAPKLIEVSRDGLPYFDLRSVLA